MVGRPTLPQDAEHRPGLQGIARPTEGLNALDQEREGSMADEGGTSGMVMESESPGDLREGLRGHGRYADHPSLATRAAAMTSTSGGVPWPYLAAGVLALGVVAVVALTAGRRR